MARIYQSAAVFRGCVLPSIPGMASSPKPGKPMRLATAMKKASMVTVSFSAVFAIGASIVGQETVEALVSTPAQGAVHPHASNRVLSGKT